MSGLPTLREAELALRCAVVDENGDITISDLVAQRIRLQLELLRAADVGHRARVFDSPTQVFAELGANFMHLGEEGQ